MLRVAAVATREHITAAIVALVAFAVTASPAGARTMRVTRANVDRFHHMNRADRFVCYRDPRGGYRLGRVNRPTARPGALWTEWTAARSAALERRAARLERRFDRARGEAAHRRIDRQLAAVTVQLSSSALLQPLCAAGPDRLEFLGDPRSLAPYRNELTRAEIRHLLDKVAFGGSKELERIGAEQGLAALVDALVDGIAGETPLEREALYWASRQFFYYTDDPAYRGIRIWSAAAAQAGQFYRFVYSPNPLHEWMLLALSGHFATNLNAIGFSYAKYAHYGIPLHWQLLTQSAVGNFGTLAKSLAWDPAMNQWLNNNDNHRGRPNQNYPRELLELFTLGAVDPITGAPNYGEDTIVAATSFMSGFFETSQIDPETREEVVATGFDPELHEDAAQTVFAGIAGAEATASSNADGFVDHVLYRHPGAARYLADRFAGQMLYPGLPEPVVAELARVLVTGNYEWKPFLKRVLGSQAMFSPASRRPCVSAPVEFFVHLARKLLHGTTLPKDGPRGEAAAGLLVDLAERSRAAGQMPFEPPSVFGWKGACNINRARQVAFGEGWITSQRVLNRSRGCLALMDGASDVGADLVTTLLPSPRLTPEAIVEHLAWELYGLEPTAEQRAVLVHFLRSDPDGNGGLVPVRVDVRNPDWAARKLPRLVCLLGELVEANLR